MKLIISKRKNKDMKLFSEKQWNISDQIHYGQGKVWNQTSYYIRAIDDGKILGLIHYTMSAGVIEVPTLIVSQENQGKGIGKSLMQKVEAVGKKNTIHKIHLITGKGWDAEGFYKALGFKQLTVIPNHYFHRDFVIYEKTI